MPLAKVFIPYGGYWSTPFCRWQGALGGEHAIELAAQVATKALAARSISPEVFDGVVLGMTVPQPSGFYGVPWLAGLVGAPKVTGPTVSQACATSARVLATAAYEIEVGARACMLGIACDRTSNGPHLYYPKPQAPGGRGQAEDWVWDNFTRDPLTAKAMIVTAENVAKAEGFSKAAQDEVTLLRFEQYQAALADDRAFQKRYMADVELRQGKKSVMIRADEGVFPTTAEGLAKLKPVLPEGTVSFGTQTFPADGNAGMVLCGKEQARRLAPPGSPCIQVLAFGDARVEKAFMPRAVVPAARKALASANLAIADCAAVKTHNPFAVNDLFFAREMKWAPERFNRYGSSLIYGHPQGPTGLRALIELIEELVEQGGGHGLFSGCAAGDTAMAAVVRVE